MVKVVFNIFLNLAKFILKVKVCKEKNYHLIAKSKYFDKIWYVKTYPDVKRSRVDPVLHYLEKGWKEGRNPSLRFSTRNYFAANPDVKRANINPLLHYLRNGVKESRLRNIGKESPPAVPFIEVTLNQGSQEKTSVVDQVCEQKKIRFSVVMPTYNRLGLIEKAIESLLAQTFQDFELIIVDDGSTDGTEDVLRRQYKKEIRSGKIRYFYKENGGCCRARNYGLQKAQYEWIAYLDSDNQVYPHFLQTFADAIATSRAETFYAQWDMVDGSPSPNKPFNYANLISMNFIDLGVFAHSKKIYDLLGGFDENLSRLVDWELIIRYTKRFPPQHIEKSVLWYNNVGDYERITTHCALDVNRQYIWNKHRPKVSLIVHLDQYVTKQSLKETVDCLCAQTLKELEFIFVDDGVSSDVSQELLQLMRTDLRVRIIKNDKFAGLALSWNNGIRIAAGEYLAFFKVGNRCNVTFFEDLYKAAGQGAAEVVTVHKNAGIEVEASIYMTMFIRSHNLAHQDAGELGSKAFFDRADYYCNQRAEVKNQSYQSVTCLKMDKVNLRLKVPQRRQTPTFGNGDYFLSLDLQEALINNHANVAFDYYEDYGKFSAGSVNVLMRGLIPIKSLPLNSLNMMYLYSHPMDVTEAELSQFDICCSASPVLVNQYAGKLNTAFYYVPQFTNTKRFYPKFDESVRSRVLLIGNNLRASRYELVRHLFENEIPLSLYGNLWQKYPEIQERVKAVSVENTELYKYYSSAEIVINDTYQDMLEWGIVSNRVYDVTACKGFLISDYNPELEKVYGDAIPMYRTKEECATLIQYYLEHPEERAEKAERAYQITIQHYTTEVVAKQLLVIIAQHKYFKWNKRRILLRLRKVKGWLKGRFGYKRDYKVIAPSALFNRAWYLAQYPDVQKTGTDPILHYVKYGWKEGRNPGPSFDGTRYLQKYPDVGAISMNPLVHYIKYGSKEGRKCEPVPVRAAAKPQPKASSSEVEVPQYQSLKQVARGIETIQSILKNPAIQCVSFDVFDTLLLRPAMHAHDLFCLVDQRLQKEHQLEFLKYRVFASEKLANKPVSLDEIYLFIQTEFDLSDDVIAIMKNMEQACEQSLLTRREDIYRVYESAVRLGKRIIAISDTYYSADFVKEVLKKNGYTSLAGVYVSSEHKVSKNTGALYEIVKTKEQTEEIFHIGANKASDCIQALKSGLTAFHYPSIQEALAFRKSIYRTLWHTQSKDPMARILLGYTLNSCFSDLTVLSDSPHVFADFAHFVSLGLSPVLLQFVLRLGNNQNVQTKYNQLLFTSQGGYLLQKAYDIYAQYQKVIPSAYLHIALQSSAMGSYAEIQRAEACQYYETILKDANLSVVLDCDSSSPVAETLSMLTGKAIESLPFETCVGKEYKKYNLLYQELFSSLEGRCSGFKNQKPILEAFEFSKDMQTQYAEIESSALAFVEKACLYFGDYLPYLSVKDLSHIQRSIAFALENSPYAEIKLFRSIMLPSQGHTAEPKSLAYKLGQVVAYENVFSLTGFENPEFSIKRCNPLAAHAFKIGIHYHSFHMYLCQELLDYLHEFPSRFDLIVTVCRMQDIKLAERFFTKETIPNLDHLIVRFVENRGRDIAPWLVGTHDLQSNYDLFCHIQSKISNHWLYGDDWRFYLFDNLVQKDAVIDILNFFEENQDLGCLFPAFYPKLKTHMINVNSPLAGRNFEVNCVHDLMQRMGFNPEVLRQELLFSAGTMLWYRPQALKALFDLNLQVSDFPPEPIGINGTIAHALERLPALVCMRSGYQVRMFNKK